MTNAQKKFIGAFTVKLLELAPFAFVQWTTRAGHELVVHVSIGDHRAGYGATKLEVDSWSEPEAAGTREATTIYGYL